MRAALLLAVTIVACNAPKSGAPKTPATDAAPPAAIDHVAIAHAVVEDLAKGDFDAVTARFDAAMAKLLGPDRLRQAWIAGTAAGGGYKSIAAVTEQHVGDKVVVIVTVQLATGTVDVRVAFDEKSAEVGGLHMGPVTQTDAWAAPAYVDASKIACAEQPVGAGPLALPGTMCTPKIPGPFPLVILVSGSGPNDRDESIGPSKPFRDLGEGLAAHGVATLRFEKRTHGHMGALAIKPEQITIKEEYLDDVAAAVQLARTTPYLDAKRVFVLGHSEGGYVVPMILAANPDVAGAVILSGSARPLAAIIPEQIRYIAMLDGRIDPIEEQGIESMERQAKRAADPNLPLDTPASDLPFGVPAAYWRSLQGYDPPALAAKLGKPLLVLQGGRDYQVTVADDLAAWKRALGGKKDVTFKVYPPLNHAYFAGEGKIAPSEYERAGHVDAEVVGDIATWITSH